jgi:hypothetical protein
VLRRGHDHHSDGSWTRLLRGLDAGDPDGEGAAAWIAVQELRLLYRHTNPTRAAATFYRWLTFCADSAVPELQRLARTLGSWRNELLARFTVADVSDGPTEAINLLIKKVKRVGHGLGAPGRASGLLDLAARMSRRTTLAMVRGGLLCVGFCVSGSSSSGQLVGAAPASSAPFRVGDTQEPGAPGDAPPRSSRSHPGGAPPSLGSMDVLVPTVAADAAPLGLPASTGPRWPTAGGTSESRSEVRAGGAPWTAAPSSVIVIVVLIPASVQDRVAALEVHRGTREVADGQPVGHRRRRGALDLDLPLELRGARRGSDRHEVPSDVPVGGPAVGEPAAALTRRETSGELRSDAHGGSFPYQPRTA